MTWIQWVATIVGSWVLMSVPASLLFGRLLRSQDPLADIPVIADADRRPLPPALRDAQRPTVAG